MKELPDSDRIDKRHPIAVVAERTGLSQDVLRVWERRYSAVEPHRGTGGQRVYSDADIARLTMLNAVTRAGRSIGQVASLPDAALAALLEEDGAAREQRVALPDASLATRRTVETALVHARALDTAALHEILTRAAATHGISNFLELVAVPLLRRLGDEWHSGRLAPAQEHVATAVIHDIIVDTMRGFAQRSGAPRIVVATPVGERHAIGAALVGAAAAVHGWNVLYFGGDLPANEIAEAARVSRAQVVAVSIVFVQHREHLLDEMRTLRAEIPDGVVLIAGGAGAGSIRTELTALGIRVETSVPGLLAALAESGGEA
jgi:DNA-binding transcriptional MerR regulator/methylmalonyl-CoA mutase cobalamin-binding subunit